jgi:hypothetical protein
MVIIKYTSIVLVEKKSNHSTEFNKLVKRRAISVLSVNGKENDPNAADIASSE